MGNSGSIHNINGEITGLEKHYFKQNNVQLGNGQSVVCDSLHKYQQIKVLPTLDNTDNANARLRSTNNGKILHNGGTLTGRKDSTSNGIYRSRSITSQHSMEQNKSQPRSYQLMQRSQTQITLAYDRRKIESKSIQQDHVDKKIVNNSLKGYGSEPNLSGKSDSKLDEKLINDGLHAKVTTKLKLTKEIRKKKMPAPDPPNNRENAINPIGWKVTNQTKNSSQNELPSMTRKLRLFKTKAESQKHSTQYEKLEAEPSSLNLKHSWLNRLHPTLTTPSPNNSSEFSFIAHFLINFFFLYF